MPRQPHKETQEESDDGKWSRKTRLQALLFFLCGFAIVVLVPEWLEVSRLSLRSLQVQLNKRGNNRTEGSSTGFSNQVAWIHFEDFPIDESSNLTFPSEDEWLLPTALTNDQGMRTSLSSTNIPKLLHKIIFTRNGEFPPAFFANSSASNNETMVDEDEVNIASLENAHRSWKKFNPDFSIRYYNLRLARQYLQQHFHPIFLRAFDCIEAFAGKADFFRYCVLYREGGFYSDWKQQCMVDGLLNKLAQNCTWFSALDHGMPKSWFGMQNSFIGSIPRHPVLVGAIRGIFVNLQRKYDEHVDEYAGGMTTLFSLTGPLLLGAAVQKAGLQEGVNGVKYAIFQANWGSKIIYNGDFIVMHKCPGCENNCQNWTSGNNYFDKFLNNEYFCPDAESLLATTVNH